MGDRVRALGLFSGGLDSMLAVKLLQEQEIEVIGYAFATPFFGPEQAIKSSKEVGIQLEVWEITERYMELMKAPKYGFGKFSITTCLMHPDDTRAQLFDIAGFPKNLDDLPISDLGGALTKILQGDARR